MTLSAPNRDLVRFAALLAGFAAGSALAGALWPGGESLHLRPPAPGSAAEALAIAANNGALAATILVCAALLRFDPPRREARGQQLGHRVVGYAVAALAIANAVAVGAQLGALGPAALGRVAPHAPLELGGFALAGLAYFRARRGALTRRGLARLGAGALALLALGGLCESLVSGTLG